MARRQQMKKDSRIEIYPANFAEGITEENPIGLFFQTGYEGGLPEIGPADDGATTLYEHEKAVEKRSSKSEFLKHSFDTQMTKDEAKAAPKGAPWLAILTGDSSKLPISGEGEDAITWDAFDAPHTDKMNLGVRYVIDYGTYYAVYDYGATDLKPALGLSDGKLKFECESVGSASKEGYPDYSERAKA